MVGHKPENSLEDTNFLFSNPNVLYAIELVRSLSNYNFFNLKDSRQVFEN